jgi:integrative and conjugative element protein (TIGR02256 family)
VPLTFLRSDGSTFQLADQALETLLAHRQVERSAKEAGGILLGRLLLDSNDAIVDEASQPAKVDRRGRFFFHRARAPAQERVTATWMRSNGSSQYLGEWHTHPQDDPIPSNKDLSDWSRLLHVTVCDHASLFFAIVGLERIRVWEGSRITGAITLTASMESE